MKPKIAAILSHCLEESLRWGLVRCREKYGILDFKDENLDSILHQCDLEFWNATDEFLDFSESDPES